MRKFQKTALGRHCQQFLPFIRNSGEKIKDACNIFFKPVTLYKTRALNLVVAIPTPETLIAQCLTGDRIAYRTLYDRYARAMYNTALRITGDRADAEDVLQDAFADAFAQLGNIEKRSSFGSWLKQIVIYKSIGLLKNRKVRFDQLDDNDQNVDDEAADEDEIQLTVERIRIALMKLPPGYRTVLSLYLMEGYDQDEISEILHLAPGSVRSQYKRGKQKLLQLLKTHNSHE